MWKNEQVNIRIIYGFRDRYEINQKHLKRKWETVRIGLQLE